MTTIYHIPALADECIEGLDIKPNGTYLDLTFGGGGHSRLILSHLGPEGRLFAFDQDADAAANVPDDERLCFVPSNFRFLRSQLRLRGVGDGQVDGILADLGVSFHHFDTAERGFSFRADAPLDMRMNQSAKLSAKEVVNDYSAEELARLLREYGELETTHKIASCIVRYREHHEGINTTAELMEAVAPCTPKKDSNKFLTKLFQALRIEVNGEMEAIKMALEQALKVLRPGGRIAVIAYHSLEDRLVKNFFRSGNFEGKAERDPIYGGSSSPFVAVSKKAIVPSAEEVERNPRSRSAKLRVAAKQ